MNGRSLSDWLDKSEKKSSELSRLGLASAWRSFVIQNRGALSVSFTEQRFSELGANFEGELAVLFGYPLEHSLSPALHNFFNLGLSSRFGLYLPTQVESEGQFLQILRNWRGLPLVGANVTSPFKECAFRYLLEHGHLSKEARIIGAVNTIYSSKGRICGDNTDWCGWLASWHHCIREELAGRNVVIFGAGGAARAVVYALIRSKVKSITVVNSPQRGQKLAADFNVWQRRENLGQHFVPVHSCSAWHEACQPGYVYIQATVLGSLAFPYSTPYNWPSSATSKKANIGICKKYVDIEVSAVPLACDLIYNPAQTEFIRLAKQNESKTMNGLGMLICQAYRSRAEFFGLNPSESEEKRLLNDFSSF